MFSEGPFSLLSIPQHLEPGMCPQRDLGKEAGITVGYFLRGVGHGRSEPLNERGFMEIGSDSAGGVYRWASWELKWVVSAQ